MIKPLKLPHPETIERQSAPKQTDAKQNERVGSDFRQFLKASKEDDMDVAIDAITAMVPAADSDSDDDLVIEISAELPDTPDHAVAPDAAPQAVVDVISRSIIMAAIANAPTATQAPRDAFDLAAKWGGEHQLPSTPPFLGRDAQVSAIATDTERNAATPNRVQLDNISIDSDPINASAPSQGDDWVPLPLQHADRPRVTKNAFDSVTAVDPRVAALPSLFDQPQAQAQNIMPTHLAAPSPMPTVAPTTEPMPIVMEPAEDEADKQVGMPRRAVLDLTVNDEPLKLRIATSEGRVRVEAVGSANLVAQLTEQRGSLAAALGQRGLELFELSTKFEPVAATTQAAQQQQTTTSSHSQTSQQPQHSQQQATASTPIAPTASSQKSTTTTTDAAPVPNSARVVA